MMRHHETAVPLHACCECCCYLPTGNILCERWVCRPLTPWRHECVFVPGPHPLTHLADSPTDPPFSACCRSLAEPQAQQTPGTCHSCQLQPGDTVLLTAPPSQHCKRRAAARSRSAQPPACTAEELTLHVKSLLGKGAVAEVYEVTVLRHVLPAAAAGAGSNDPAAPAAEQDAVTPAPPAAAPAATTGEDDSHHRPAPPAPAPAAAAAPAAGPLQDLHLALRVCQRWEALPQAVQIRVYADDASTYEGLVSNNMQASHWAMSSPVLGAGTHILRSRVLGSVRRVPKPAADTTATAGPEAPDPAAAAAVEVVARSPALLMDLAEGGSLRQQMDRMRDG